MSASAHTSSPRPRLAVAALLFCLLLSFGLWYVIELSHTYTTSVPVTVRVEGNRIRVNPTVEATGYQIFLHRYFTRSRIDASLEELGAVESAITPGNWVVDPLSLQNLISLSNSDLRIVSVGSIPEIVIAPATGEEEEPGEI